MGNIREWWSAHRPTTRRLAQLYCALLYNANLKGFVDGEIFTGNTKTMCVPGFNCYSCPGAVGACPLGSLQNALATSGTHAGSYMFGIILLFGLILGRTICGWLCPLGMFQELLHKIPTPKILKNRVTRVLSYLKYVILLVFVIAIPMWFGMKYDLPTPGFCKYICPAGTFEGAMGLLGNAKNSGLFSMLDILFTRKVVIFLVIVLLCIFCYRAFCRFLCPLGAIYGLFNRFAIIGVKVNPSKCTHCGNCVRKCQMDVRHVGDHECISCGECMSVCAAGAISLKAGGFTLKAPEISKKELEKNPALEQSQKKRRTNGRIAWAAALVFLAAALYYYNVFLPGEKKKSSDAASAVQTVSQTGDSGQSGNGGDSGDGDTAGDGLMSTGKETEADSGMSSSTVEADSKDAGKSDSAGSDEEAGKSGSAGSDETEGKGDASGADKEAAAAVTFESSAPIGSSEGEQLKDFEMELFGGGTFHLKDKRGKIVIINRWATWCPACVQEVPFFCQISEENPDVYVLLVHANPVMGGLDEYLEKKQWGLDVVTDNNSEICDIVNGSSTLPQTTVLNSRGEVVYNQTGSVTYEKLSALVEKARNSAPTAAISKEDSKEEAGSKEEANSEEETDSKEEAGSKEEANSKEEAGSKEEANSKEETDSQKDSDSGKEMDSNDNGKVDESAETVTYESTAPIGSSEGEQLKDFEMELFGGGTFHLKDKRGKIVIINRWATWCPACVQEVPFFCQISEENPDVYVLLVHANPVMGGLDEYLEKKQWGLDVVTDNNSEICDIVNGSSTLPQTTVLNSRGEVVYNQTGSVTYEKLNALVEKARKS